MGLAWPAAWRGVERRSAAGGRPIGKACIDMSRCCVARVTRRAPVSRARSVSICGAVRHAVDLRGSRSRRSLIRGTALAEDGRSSSRARRVRERPRAGDSVVPSTETIHARRRRARLHVPFCVRAGALGLEVVGDLSGGKGVASDRRRRSGPAARSDARGPRLGRHGTTALLGAAREHAGHAGGARRLELISPRGLRPLHCASTAPCGCWSARRLVRDDGECRWTGSAEDDRLPLAAG